MVKTPRHRREFGAETPEFSIVFLVAAIGLPAVIWLVASSESEALKSGAFLVALLGAGGGVLAWAGKAVVSASRSRARLYIREILSDGTARTRDELKSDLRRGSLRFRLAHLHIDALADLVNDGVVTVDAGSYRLSERKDPGEGA